MWIFSGRTVQTNGWLFKYTIVHFTTNSERNMNIRIRSSIWKTENWEITSKLTMAIKSVLKLFDWNETLHSSTVTHEFLIISGNYDDFLLQNWEFQVFFWIFFSNLKPIDTKKTKRTDRFLSATDTNLQMQFKVSSESNEYEGEMTRLNVTLQHQCLTINIHIAWTCTRTRRNFEF